MSVKCVLNATNKQWMHRIDVFACYSLSTFVVVCQQAQQHSSVLKVTNLCSNMVQMNWMLFRSWYVCCMWCRNLCTLMTLPQTLLIVTLQRLLWAFSWTFLQYTLNSTPPKLRNHTLISSVLCTLYEICKAFDTALVSAHRFCLLHLLIHHPACPTWYAQENQTVIHLPHYCRLPQGTCTMDVLQQDC